MPEIAWPSKRIPEIEAVMVMSISGWLALAGAGLCAAVASVLLKNAASLGLSILSVRVLALDVGALAVYGVGFFLYGYSLRFFQVGAAYVCMVAIAAVLFFLYSLVHGEPIHAREWIGAGVVVLGVFLIAGVRR
jgi:drug/metabolite transporter (DMT)-like permease